MFVLYVDTPEELRQALIEYVGDLQVRALGEVKQYKNQRDQQAQQARANTYQSMKLFLTDLKLATTEDYMKMKERSRPAFGKE